MFWVILIAGIIVYIIYSFFRDRDQMLVRQVDVHGGMKDKYSILISELTRDSMARITNVTRYQIRIEARGQTTLTCFVITENFNTVQIQWVAQLAVLGTHRHQWSFHPDYPQAKMIREIAEYIEWKADQMFGNVSDNDYPTAPLNYPMKSKVKAKERGESDALPLLKEWREINPTKTINDYYIELNRQKRS